jgi:hypothetical protein
MAQKKSAISALSPLLLGYGFLRIGQQSLIFSMFLPREGRPEGGGAAGGQFAVAGGCVEEREFLERGVDTLGVDVAMKETPDLIFRQSLGGFLDCLANAVGDGVTGGVAEEEG